MSDYFDVMPDRTDDMLTVPGTVVDYRGETFRTRLQTAQHARGEDLLS